MSYVKSTTSFPVSIKSSPPGVKIVSSIAEPVFFIDPNSGKIKFFMVHSVEPDNRVTPIGLTVITQQSENRLNTIIISEKSIKTLISTFNDLIETLEVVISVLEDI